MHQTIKITQEQYHQMLVPRPGFAVIAKDPAPRQVGGLLMTQSTRDRMLRYSATGKIIALSPLVPEGNHDKYLNSIFKIGDHVGFDSTIPILAPLPCYYDLQTEENSDATVLLHLADIYAVFCKDDETRASFLVRVNSATEKLHGA